MNTLVTSKEAILETCRRLVSEKGLSSLNMRAVANACQVALGSLYYYFPSKDDLLIATVESVWTHIFSIEEYDAAQLSFPQYIGHWFDHIQNGAEEYPNFFNMHSLSFASSVQGKARETMDRYFSRIREAMLLSLRADPLVSEDAFYPGFQESDLIDFVLSNILFLLIQQRTDCQLLIEMVRRAIYRH